MNMGMMRRLRTIGTNVAIGADAAIRAHIAIVAGIASGVNVAVVAEISYIFGDSTRKMGHCTRNFISNQRTMG